MNVKKISETAKYYLAEFIADENETIAEAKENGEKLTAYCFYRYTEVMGNEFECAFDTDWYDEEDGWELWAKERVA